MATNLTTRQESILKYIVDYIQTNSYPPTIREIGSQFEISSLRGVTVHLDAMERKGYISRGKNPRTIQILHPDYKSVDSAVMVPLLGTIAAGSPILADGQVEDLLPVPKQMIRGDKPHYILRVKGDSMINDGILARDLVVIRQQSEVGLHQIAAVLVDDEATIKRVQKDNGRLLLVSSNPAYEPIVADPSETRILGQVVGLLRDYDGHAF